MDLPSLILLVLLFASLGIATWMLERQRERLARMAWYRKLELLSVEELRTNAMLAIGAALLALSALLTLGVLLGDTGLARWLLPLIGLPLGVMAVAAMVLGAMLLERANQRERWR